MTTEYTIVSSEPGQIVKEDVKSITIGRTALAASGTLAEMASAFGTSHFFVMADRVIQIIAAIDTGEIVGIPIEIVRPNEAEAVRCAIIDSNCEYFV